MLLRQLKLQNIRSYRDQTIAFPSGTIVLSGDIGCGKSSLLLAIEFALFGVSRPDLPAEALLRKDSLQGSVELTFFLNGQEISIKRNLKKEKDGIKQLPGHIILNNVKKELMPIELKAEIINLLGYPEDMLTKNKNYIFRYTVYTPQEEMKLILQENVDVRLDVLRKIFNIDKYKIIRENLSVYLKEMRTKLALLEAKIEPLDQQKILLEQLNKDKSTIAEFLNILEPKLFDKECKLKEMTLHINQLDEQQRIFSELKQYVASMKVLTEEKTQRREQFVRKQEQLSLEITQLLLPQDVSEDKIKMEIKAIEDQKRHYFTMSTSLRENINQIQKSIVEIQQYSQEIQPQISMMADKEILRQQLIIDLNGLTELKEKKKQLEELLERTFELITKNKTILQQSLELEEKVASLETCPTCLQEVSPSYKEHIAITEQQKIKQAENLLFELQKKRVIIIEQREDVLKKIEELAQKENLLTKTKVELIQLQEKGELLKQKQEKMRLLVQDNNQLMQQLGRLEQDEKNSLLDQKLSRQQELLSMLMKRNYLQQQLKELIGQIEQYKEELNRLNTDLQKTELLMMTKEDLTSVIVEKRAQLNQLLSEEKLLAVEKSQWLTKQEYILKQVTDVMTVVKLLTEESNTLKHRKELYHWMEEYFLKLTYAIEKQMMVNIYHIFNQLFQEWFAILLDDENVYARLDDSFTPVIEQNGYEIAFPNLSGGEKTAASLAYRLALNRVINDVIHDIKTKDLLILDEPTDGFSSEQLDKVREVLERLQLKQTIIVSHEQKIETFVENVIRVRKEGQVSGVVA